MANHRLSNLTEKAEVQMKVDKIIIATPHNFFECYLPAAKIK